MDNNCPYERIGNVKQDVDYVACGQMKQLINSERGSLISQRYVMRCMLDKTDLYDSIVM